MAHSWGSERLSPRVETVRFQARRQRFGSPSVPEAYARATVSRGKLNGAQPPGLLSVASHETNDPRADAGKCGAKPWVQIIFISYHWRENLAGEHVKLLLWL
jgi:hypothetical protein